jgi:polyhydroxybutyrate depolymerase
MVNRVAVPLLIAIVLAVAGCSSSGSSAGNGSSQTSAPHAQAGGAADCTPARTIPATPREHSIVSAGVARAYLLDLPPGYDGRTAGPMVLDFHGFASNAVEQDARTQLSTKGGRRGYIVVTPQSMPPQWNLAAGPKPADDDYAFIDSLVSDLEHQLCVDPHAVFAAGHSNGSAFAGFLVCREPYRFAGVAMVSATVPSACPAPHRPWVMAVAGTSDPSVPYNGGTVAGSTIHIPSVADTFAGYQRTYRCTTRSPMTTPQAGIQRQALTGCAGGAQVQFDSVIGGTHAWPGSSAATADATDSPAGKTFDASDAILDFFDAARRSG